VPGSKRRVRVALRRFWSDNLTPQALFAGLPFLFDHFDFVIDPDPDFVIFSSYPGALPAGRAVRIFYTGENVRPDMSACDWAFSFDYDEELRHPRHLRLPNYRRLGAGADLIKSPGRAESILSDKTQFCNFVYHAEAPVRLEFFDKLSRYARVDAPGRSRQNLPPIGGHPDSTSSRYAPGYHRQKIEFQRRYKFTIAFENASWPGYTTEKIYHAMLADTVPIYWGNPLVHRDFNTRSFLNAADFASLDDLVDAVAALDRDEDRYLAHLREPWYPGNRPTRYVDDAVILDRFQQIFGEGGAG
jgi:hypothetical protein